MATACQNCGGSFNHLAECPACGVPQDYTPTGHGSSLGQTDPGTGWQHSATGRVAIGLLLAQGLALCVRLFLNAGALVAAAAAEDEVWVILYQLLLRQGLEMLCLFAACVLAGAGQNRGITIGAFIGVANAFIVWAIDHFQHVPTNDVELYARPLLQAFVGSAGGFLGGIIWRPLPVLNLAPVGIRKRKRPDRTAQLFAGPIAWFRVLVGAAVVVLGVVSPTVILSFLMYHTQGQLQISSQLQSTMVTWELIGLFILIGSGIAGFNTLNGPKQGLCVGIAASFLIVGYQLSRPRFGLDETIFTAFVIMTLSLVGSWFSCRLFPPVINGRRRRLSEAP